MISCSLQPTLKAEAPTTNCVERRMAPLSRVLAGLILPHDPFRSDQGDNKNETDEASQLKNCENAGTALAEVWSRLNIDGHNVHAGYVPSSEDMLFPNELSPEWCVTHIRESQYMIQVLLVLFLNWK